MASKRRSARVRRSTKRTPRIGSISYKGAESGLLYNPRTLRRKGS